VRGLVAGYLGLEYEGIELRAEQVRANRRQAERIAGELARPPVWLEGDCREEMPKLGPDPSYDFVFTCPPYGSLEHYSDDPRDLSAMDEPSFDAALEQTLALSAALLLEDRFAVWVIGDERRRTEACASSRRV
jgi:hypothetical protein